jgi:hypothetical protein
MQLLKGQPTYDSTASPGSDFLSQLEVNYGPVGLLGRFFLRANSEVRARGLTLHFAPIKELVETNEANRDSWLPLLPIFDHRDFKPTPDNFFCIVARDPKGRIVGTHACRLFDWTGTNFHEEATSLRLFYEDPERMRRPGEKCEVTAPSAKTVTGLTVFSGAAWYHPDYRGRGLSRILPHIGKAYALTQWPAETIVSIMAEEIHQRGFAKRFGYTNVDWAVHLTNSVVGTRRVAFLSVKRDETFHLIAEYLADSFEIDIGVLGGHA